MAKGATSKSKTKNEENKNREEQQKQQTNQKRADSKPQRSQTAETKPTTQEAAPKPVSTQIPTLEPKYASPEQIEEARDVGRRSLEMARAGQLDMSEKIPFTQGVEGYAEQYRIPELEETPSTTMPSDNYAPQTRQSYAEAPNYNASERDYMMQQNALRNEQRRAENVSGPVDILGSRRAAGEGNGYDKRSTKIRQESSFDSSLLSDRELSRLEEIDRDIARISERSARNMGSREDQRRLSGLQAERNKITGQNLLSEDKNTDDVVGTWLDPDYKMGRAEIEQARQLIDDYDRNEYKNSNIYNLTDEESQKLSQINALRDKVSKAEATVYGSMNATPGVDALLKAGDNDYYGWTLDDLRDEVARQRDIPMSGEVRDAVNQLRSEIDSLQNTVNDANTVYSTGDVAVDETIGANTSLSRADALKEIERKQAQMYKLMLESARGEEGPNYDSYSLRKANAQKQNPVQYTTGDMATRVAETMALQGAMGSNGLLADLTTDALTDTIPELQSNLAGGMSEKDAYNRAFVSGLVNTGLDLGAWGMSNLDELIPSLRNANEVADAVKQNEVNPADLARQNEIDVNAKVDSVNQAVDEINNLAEQVPGTNIGGNYIDELRQSLENADAQTKAQTLVDGGYYSDMIEAGEAYQRGELDDAVNDFLTKMERNGDPTPTKNTVDTNSYDHQALNERYGGNWEAMRRGTIKEYTGVDDAKADEYYDALRRFVGGRYPQEGDTAILDDYISKAPTYQGQITRGMHFNPEDGSYDDFMKKVHESGVVTLEKPSSWATDLESARVYSHMGDDGVDSIEIVCNKNRTSSPIDFINGQGEDEVISSSNASWTVLNEETYTRPNGSRKTILRVAETGDKTPPKDAVVMPTPSDNTAITKTDVENAPAIANLPEAPKQDIDAIAKVEAGGGAVPPTNNPPRDLGFDPNDPYVPDPNAMRNNQIPNVENPRAKDSKLGTNTMRTLDGDEANANDLSRGIYSYVPKEEQGTMRVAAKRVAESPNKAYNEILNTADDAFTAEDVDTSMMLRNKLKEDLALARESGDERTANYLQTQLDALTIRQRKAATNAGQVSQAWAKWSRDADGATFASYNIAARQYEDAIKNNPRLGEEAHSIAERISDDIARITSKDLSNESVDELSEQIQGMIKSVVDKEGNYRIRRNFKEANIKKISDTLATEIKQGEDISQTLEMIERAGVTGFTGLDDSVEAEVRELFERAEMFGYNSKQRVELEDQAYSRLAQALNLTGGIYDKIDAIRYFAMLANPKTHLRNVIGNYTFGEITNFKDQLAGILEEAVDRASLKRGARAAERGVELKRGGQGIDRTTTFIRKNGADRSLHQASLDDFDNNAYRELVGDKWISSEKSIEGNKNVFGYGKVGSAASDVVGSNAKLLEAEDVIGKRKKYADSLTRYLKANGYDESILKTDVTDRKTLEFLDEARQYAIDQAQKATFNQQNVVADALSKFSREARNIKWSDASAGARGKKLAGLFLDATVPFKRTPLNIVTSLWEYTPVHLAKIGMDITDIARHKPKAVNTLIDDIAKNLTGVGMLGAGYALAANGFITGRKDKETGDLDDLTGKQDYSLNLGNLGSYTLDWLSPSLTIMLAGANLFQSGLSAEGLSQMIADIGEPVLETTMLSSLADVLRSAQYAEDKMDTVKQAAATAAKNYVSQFVPSELGNIARSIDNTRRSTYTDKSGVAGIFDRTLQGIENKVPGLSQTNQPYINRWGDEEQNLKGPAGDNFLSRFAYNHLSPGYYSPDNTTPKDQYLYDLYRKFPDEGLLPPPFSTSITVNGEKRKVTPEEKTTKDTAEGHARGALVTAISENEAIQRLSYEQQTQIVKDSYALAKLIGNASIIDGYTSDDKAYNTYVNGGAEDGGVEAFINYELGKLGLKEAGIATNSNAGSAVQTLYDEGDAAGAEQLTQTLSSLSDAGVSTAGLGVYSDRGITFLGDIDPEQYADLWNKINTNNKPDSPNGSIAQGELLDYFNANPNEFKDQETAMRYWLGLLTDYDDTKKVPYYDTEDNAWKTHARTGADIALINKLSTQNESSQIEQPTQQNAAPMGHNVEPVYSTVDKATALQQIESSGANIPYAEEAWLKASAIRPALTVPDFINTFSAIDAADGSQNGHFTDAGIRRYMNENQLTEAMGNELIKMYVNSRWTKPVYDNGTWK